MKQSGIIAIVFVVGCATGGVAAQLVVPPVRAGTSPTRWEYQCLSLGTEGRGVTSTLNKVGAEGWELATFTVAHEASEMIGGSLGADEYVACVKRALP